MNDLAKTISLKYTDINYCLNLGVNYAILTLFFYLNCQDSVGKPIIIHTSMTAPKLTCLNF